MAVWSHLFRSWRSQTAVQTATFAVLIGTFCILTLCLTIQHNLKILLTRWGSEVQVSVYLKDSVEKGQIEKIRQNLETSELFEKVEYLSKEGAAELFSKKIGHLSPTLLNDNSFANPLPASFEGYLKGGVSSGSSYEALVRFAKSISALAGVEEVSYGQGWIENYASALKAFTSASWALVGVLLLGGLFVVGNSIRSSIANRREEIALYELFGATPWTIQWPYIFEGAVMAGAAGVVSLALGYGLFSWAHKVWVRDLQFWSQQIEFTFLSPLQIVFVILISLTIGSLGSFFCVRKVNTGWAAAETW